MQARQAIDRLDDKINTHTNTIDDTSRVLHITGDGVPEIPDSIAGTTYKNIAGWTSGVGGWLGNNTNPTIVGGYLSCSANGIYNSGIIPTNNMLVFSIKTVSDTTVNFGVNASPALYSRTVQAGVWTLISQVFGVQSTALNIGYASTGAFVIKDVYFGTGAYTTPVFDRAGQYNFANTACLPVYAPDGKGLSFNGTTAFLLSQNFFSVPELFSFYCEWSGIENLASPQMIFGQKAAEHTAIYRQTSSTILRVGYWNGSSNVSVDFASYFTSSSHKIGVQINRTAGTITAYKDGVLFEVKSGLTIVLNTTAEYLYIGKRIDGYPLKGTLNHIRIDSRIWTADEMARLAIDPSDVDSQVKSVIPAPNAIQVAGSSGETYGSTVDGTKYATKVFKGTTAATVSADTSIPHGLTQSKIISMIGSVFGGNGLTTPISTILAGTPEPQYHQIYVCASSTNIVTSTTSGTNTAYLSRPFVVLITYEL